MVTSRARPAYVGIDLGTTYSSLSFLDENAKPHGLPNEHGELLTPSIVFFPPDGSPPIVGQDAIECSYRYPERFIEHAKRYLGSSNMVWEIDGIVYTPVDISAIIIAQLLSDAASTIGKVTDAVVTVPAHFTGHQRELTIQAAKQAGLVNVSIVNEPVAAALAYVLEDRVGRDDAAMLSLLESDQEAESTILVYDLGGGTFDLSIVRYDRQHLRVLAASGDERLGGIDWDDKLLDIVATGMRAACGDIRQDLRALRRARPAIEAAKRSLSKQTVAELTFDFRGEQAFVATRQEFELETQQLVERTRKLTENLLASCQLTWNDLECILPVGGATLMPMIQRTIKAFADQVTRPVRNEKGFIRKVSPHMSIAHGAALFSGVIHGPSSPAGITAPVRLLSNYKVSNVAANSVGILVVNPDGQRRVHQLIRRSEPLPRSVNVTVATTKPNQDRASVRIVEAGVNAQDAKVLCKCTITELPSDLPANSLLDVTVNYDVDGLLNLIVKHRDTGRLATVSALYSSV